MSGPISSKRFVTTIPHAGGDEHHADPRQDPKLVAERQHVPPHGKRAEAPAITHATIALVNSAGGLDGPPTPPLGTVPAGP